MNTQPKVTISIPEGYEFDTIDKETGDIKLRLKESKYPKSIEEIDLPAASYYISSNWNVCQELSSSYKRDKRYSDCNNLSRKEDAEALVALAQLITLRDEYNRIDGFMPKFNSSQENWVIEIYEELLSINFYSKTQRPLSFKTHETANLFLTNFKDLIKTAKPLL